MGDAARPAAVKKLTSMLDDPTRQIDAAYASARYQVDAAPAMEKLAAMLDSRDRQAQRAAKFSHLPFPSHPSPS